jgi:hypothetical protein
MINRGTTSLKFQTLRAFYKDINNGKEIENLFAFLKAFGFNSIIYISFQNRTSYYFL